MKRASVTEAGVWEVGVGAGRGNSPFSLKFGDSCAAVGVIY